MMIRYALKMIFLFQLYMKHSTNTQNNLKQAKEEYETLLRDPHLTVQLKASVLRQIGKSHISRL